MTEKTALDWIAIALVVIGGLNWGLFGISQDYDLIARIFGYSAIGRALYILVGLSGLYMIYFASKDYR
ncbi:DUF378 domain-containing protein [Methanohalophilus profundi]|uniref:DUF378 domain-containing protein n=1 Tax=Methanohalophilus profundi TaxID=2138083 RepID=UPI00101B5E3D|nr:DUF378 domain-containing protein [Methanohalophilus profundi]